MPIANCKRCGHIFNRTRRDICPNCIAEEDEAFTLVRDYLKDHRYATLLSTSEDTGVDIQMIAWMIQEGRLMVRDFPNMTYPCERCGQPTQVGRFCEKCAKELTHTFSSAAEAGAGESIGSDDEPSKTRGYHSR